MPSSTTDAVLDRAFRLLDAFRGAPQNLTLDELTARSGLPRSTAHRLAGQLEQLGALERGKAIGDVPAAYAALPPASATANGDGRVVFTPKGGEAEKDDDEEVEAT